MKRLFVLMFVSVAAQAETATDVLKSIGLSNDGLVSAKIIKNIQRKGVKKTFTNLKFEVEKNIFELEAISPLQLKEFEREQKNGIGVIVQSYSDQPTPYQGEITNTAKCPDFFKPKIKKDLKVNEKTISLIESYVDKDFNYGICDKKNIKYLTCTSFYYDTSRLQILKLKILTDPKLGCEKLSINFYRDLKTI